MDKLFYFIFFIIVLALSRIIPHPPNFTPIIASAIMAPILINNRIYGTLLPVIAMFLADIIIGFHPYMLVIYLTIASISLASPIKIKLMNIFFFSIASSVWFFLTTNFAVWLVWDYYSKNFQGLIKCYTLAIPFFTNTLLSSILFTIILFYLIDPIKALSKKFNNSIGSIFQKI